MFQFWELGTILNDSIIKNLFKTVLVYYFISIYNLKFSKLGLQKQQIDFKLFFSLMKVDCYTLIMPIIILYILNIIHIIPIVHL